MEFFFPPHILAKVEQAKKEREHREAALMSGFHQASLHSVPCLSLQFQRAAAYVSKKLQNRDKRMGIQIKKLVDSMLNTSTAKRFQKLIDHLKVKSHSPKKLILALNEAYYIARVAHFTPSKNTKQRQGEMILTVRQLASRVGCSNSIALTALNLLEQLKVIKLGRFISLKDRFNRKLKVYKTLFDEELSTKKQLILAWRTAKREHYIINNFGLYEFAKYFNTRSKNFNGATMQEIETELLHGKNLIITPNSDGTKRVDIVNHHACIYIQDLVHTIESSYAKAPSEELKKTLFAQMKKALQG